MDEYFEYFHQLNKQIHNLSKKQYDEIEEFLGDMEQSINGDTPLKEIEKYIKKYRRNKYAGANMKKNVEKDIGWYINLLPAYQNPIKIHFVWVEENKRRDLDNVCFAKKFILDSMVKAGKLKDDNRNFVKGFRDDFEYGKSSKVILEIEEIK